MTYAETRSASSEITAGQAEQFLESALCIGAVEAARCDLAVEFTRICAASNAHVRDTKRKVAAVGRRPWQFYPQTGEKAELPRK